MKLILSFYFKLCFLLIYYVAANQDSPKVIGDDGSIYGLDIFPKSMVEALGEAKNLLEDKLGKYFNDYSAVKAEPAEEENPPNNNDLKSIGATFENQSPFRVSLNWDNDEDLVRVVNIIEPGQSAQINTFPGHTFVFTREGTKDTIHKPYEISISETHYVLPADAKVDDNPCKDRFKKKCKNWAKVGECLKNPGWMIVNCPAACESCQLLDPYKRCDPEFLNVSAEPVWKAGDVDKMFERILNDKEMVEKFGISVVTGPPKHAWLLQFDNFLSPKEAELLIQWGRKLGYERSTDTGTLNERGEVTQVFSKGRTSSNAWCTGGCENDPVVKQISQRIVDITGVPYENYEQFQMLQYDLGQKYNVHHDMSPRDDARAGGVRILTFFLYLSDVEEGGETDFPRMGVKVKPKQGRAVLWPSTLNEDPMKQDPRTYHAALPVTKGLKYAANHWIHSHNFKQANKWGCTGAFS